MPNDLEIKKLVDKSYGRCRMTGVFPTEFYHYFLGLGGKEPPLCADSSERDRLLDRGIRFLILYYHEPDRYITEQLIEFGKTFELESLDIWLSALLKTVADNDPEFDSALEAAWLRVVERGISVFIENATSPA